MLLLVHSMLGFAAGTTLYWAGRRGRRIDRRAVCRCCGFDLSARGPFDSRCPECGLNLFSRRAIVRGQRTPIHALSIAGAIIMSLSLFHGVMWGVPEALKLNLSAHMPTRLLLFEANAGGGRIRTDAMVELAIRFAKGSLSTREQVETAAAALADIEASPRARTRPAALAALAEAHQAGLLSPQDALRFARSGVRMNIERRRHPGIADTDRFLEYELRASCAEEVGPGLLFSLTISMPRITDRENAGEVRFIPVELPLSSTTPEKPIGFSIPPQSRAGFLSIRVPVRVLVFDSKSPDSPIGEWQEDVAFVDFLR